MNLEWNAYHFVDDTLRDGRPVPANGETLVHEGPLEMCSTGLHASRHSFDALAYAPGSTLCRDHCGGDVIEGDDRLVCAERTIIARIDATSLLRSFARMCALDVIHQWKAPDVVRRYLQTGDEKLRDAARAAAWPAEDAAWAARDASDAPEDAPEDAARAAAWAAMGAAWAAWAARGAATAAAWAARGAARDAQRERFGAMVDAAFTEGETR